MKNTISEIKNTVEGITSKLDEAKIKLVSCKTRKKEKPRENSYMKKYSKNMRGKAKKVQEAQRVPIKMNPKRPIV